MKKQIEIELRAQFDRQKYEELYHLLQENGKYLGEDDKELHFLIFPDKLLKLVNNISTNSAKVSLKMNRIGQGNDFEEYEFKFNPKDIDVADKIFRTIAKQDYEYQFAFNQRDNFVYNGVEIALKYSNTWGYHAELEILVDDQECVQEAESAIHTVAQELGLTILSQDKLKQLTSEIDENYRQHKYSKDDFVIPTRPGK